MSAPGLRPRAGARYVLERVEAGGAPGEEAAAGTGDAPGATEGLLCLYRGFVHLPDADIPVEVRVELPGGAARASIGTGGEGSSEGIGRPAELSKALEKETEKEIERAAAAFVRSATKAGIASGGPLPRKIVRWRG